MTIKTVGIVVREKAAGESDKYVTFYTRDKGPVEVYIKNAVAKRSRFAAATSLMCYSDLVLFYNRGRYYLDEASVIDMFYDLRSDIMRLSLCSYFAELTLAVAGSEEGSDEVLRLLLNTVHFVRSGRFELNVLKAIYELRLLSICGYMPDFVGCSVCGAHSSEGAVFFPDEGKLVCESCIADGNAEYGDGVLLHSGVLMAMRHIVYSDLEKLFKFTIGNTSGEVLSRVCEDYAVRHIEGNLGTLDFWHRL